MQHQRYCHDFQQLMVSLSWLGQIMGYVEVFDEYRDRKLISTDHVSFGIHHENQQASFFFIDEDGKYHDVVLNDKGRVPAVKVIQELRTLILNHPELFRLLAENAESLNSLVIKVVGETMKLHSDDLAGKLLRYGLSDYQKLLDEDLKAFSSNWLSLWVWFFTRPHIAREFDLKLDESLTLTYCMKRPRSREYCETKVHLVHTELDNYYITLHFETINTNNSAIVYKHLEPNFWDDERLDSFELIQHLYQG
ncbi:hypothetical protein [Vibrio phage 5 TSL-2019]|nr:hypothetical protein [Vibrio phage 5 TSL-2019]